MMESSTYDESVDSTRGGGGADREKMLRFVSMIYLHVDLIEGH